MSVDLNSMAVFARVVEEQGFSSAARRLGLSKSAVSKHISQLEDRIGARLLHRTTRRLRLTDVGAAFYERCARILAEAEEAELAVSRMSAAPRGTLRVSAPVSFGSRFLAKPMAEFAMIYPELRIELVLNDRVVDLVDEGYDVALRIGRLADSSLIARRLCAMPLYIVASPKYLAKHGTPKVPADLHAHNCTLYSLASGGDVYQCRDGDRDISIKVDGTMRANNGDLLIEAVRAGLGLAFMPAFLCGCDLHDGTLVEVLRDYRVLPGAINAVYPHNRHLSAKVRVFVDFLVDHFTDLPWLPCDAKTANAAHAEDEAADAEVQAEVQAEVESATLHHIAKSLA